MQRLIFKINSKKKLKKLFSISLMNNRDITPYLNSLKTMKEFGKEFYIFIVCDYKDYLSSEKVIYSVKWGGILATGDDKLIVKFKEGIEKLK